MKKLIAYKTHAKFCAFLLLCFAAALALLALPERQITVDAQNKIVGEIVDAQKNKVDASVGFEENLFVNAQNSSDSRISAPFTPKFDNTYQTKQFTSPAASYTNSTPITITDCPSPCPATGQAATPYSSDITVSGEVGVIQRVSVTLNGYTHSFPSDVDMLLVSPSGRKVVFMSDFGAGAPGVTNQNITLDDYAATPVPSSVTGNTGFPFVTGTYRPSNSGTTDAFPAPAPASPYSYCLSQFNGDNPNGTWSLYIIDDANLDGGSVSGGWTITFDVRPPPPTAGQILVSEFRTRGAGTAPPTSDGSADEFIELYNNTNSSITIIDAIPGADPTLAAGAGWRFGGAQGAAESTFLVLPQTLSTAGPLAIPARGHYLITTAPTTPSPTGNTYSLTSYPTGTGITASGSSNISINPASATTGFLPDDVGLAVFSTAAALSANRLDSVGYSSVTNADYKEGTGLSPATGITTAGQHSWVRKMTLGVPQDTNDNANDFVLVETTGAVLNGVQSVLGAPGPERAPTATAFTTSSAPMHTPSAANMTVAPIDPTVPNYSAPNAVYDPTPVTNGPNGTLKIRRTITNTGTAIILALRYRVIQINTLGSSLVTPNADLRVLSSTAGTVTTAGGPVSTDALTLQTPPAQALGGGLNSSLSEGIITTTAPLAAGASRSVEFVLGIQTAGLYRFAVSVEGITQDVPQRGVSANIASFGCAGPASVAGDVCFALPTAANVSVSGRVTTADGRPVSRAGITMTDPNGQVRYALTNGFGYYRFDNVPVGESYIFSVKARRYLPATIVRTVVEDLADADIVLQE